VSTAGIATSSIDFERGTKLTLLVALTILCSENGDCCEGKGVEGGRWRQHELRTFGTMDKNCITRGIE